MQFDAIVGALATLVFVATFLERGLAFIFEHRWFVKLTTVEKSDPSDATKIVRVSKWPGLKGLLALGASLGISFGYDFDVLEVLFPSTNNEVTGKLLTGIVIAGGSAGAIAIFQGYLNLGKESRDAIIEARRAEATAAKEVSELAVAEARAKKDKAEAEKATSELLRDQAANGGPNELRLQTDPIRSIHNPVAERTLTPYLASRGMLSKESG